MRLLLDAHFSFTIAVQLSARSVEAAALRDWQGGTYARSDDGAILVAAAAEGRVLVTYDQRTIPALLKQWAEAGQHHAGVILVDDRTIAQDDIGGLVRALVALAEQALEIDWQDRVIFLKRA